MITLIDGLQGAGKTYYAVYYMMENQKKYFNIYTNIDGFQFDKTKNIKPLTVSWFLDLLDEAKAIYDDESTTDQDIWSFLCDKDFLNSDQRSEIKPVLMVIDEAHNLFDSKNDLLVWYMTYHRHLFIDAILITQDSNLLHFAYRKLFQNIYHAIPDSNNFKSALMGLIPFIGKKMKKRNKYQKHIRLPIYDGKNGTLTDVIYLDRKKEYYDLYNAGDEVRAKNVFTKYILYFVFLGAAAVGGLYWFTHVYLAPKKISRTSSDLRDSSSRSSVSPHRSHRVVSRASDDFEGMRYLHISCIGSSCKDRTNQVRFNLDNLQDLLKNTDSRYLSSVQYGRDMADMYLLVSSDFINLFKERTHDKKNSGFSLIH